MAHALVLVQILACFVAACSAQRSLQEIIDIVNHAANNSNVRELFEEQTLEFNKTELPDMTPEQYSTFDFVVVGGGSAGSVVASRLSENPNWTVLLVEAGGPEEYFMGIPVLAAVTQLTEIDWKYKSEPSDEYCLGMTDKQCSMPQGKVMGGTGILTCMIAIRGYKSVYDRWAALGNTGWSYEELLPYFKKLENMTFEDFGEDEELHGTNGPVHIGSLPFRTQFAESFIEAAGEIGYNTTNDYNGENQEGFSYLQMMNVDGRRLTSNGAYLHPISNRNNLFVTKYSLAQKVLINQENKSAYGIEFIKGSETYQVHASKEVILCAGTIGSAQLLMLSGIGPEDHLSEIGIPLIQNASVGKNLMDHPAYFGLVFTVNQTLSPALSDQFNPDEPYFGNWVENEGESPLTLPFNAEAIGFINVDKPFETDGEPNMALISVCNSMASSSTFREDYSITNATTEKMFGSVLGNSSWSIVTVLLTPKSRGTIELRDRNITSKPKITPNYFSHPEDVRISIAGIRKALEFSNTTTMQKYGTQVHKAQVPGCEDEEYDSDAYWECALRTAAITLSHESGTCKMGPEEDSAAVVNPELKVIGVNNLRVGGAPIMPSMPTGRILIPTVMIAEKLSDMIKEQYGFSTRNIH